MAIKDLYKSGQHSKNLGHFASLASIASADGKLGEQEEKLLKRFARKLNIENEDFKKVMKDPSAFPINPPNNADHRLERIHDLFEMIFADNEIDEDEYYLIERYAIGLGYTQELANKLISRSIEIYMGGLDFEDYRHLLNK